MNINTEGSLRIESKPSQSAFVRYAARASMYQRRMVTSELPKKERSDGMSQEVPEEQPEAIDARVKVAMDIAEVVTNANEAMFPRPLNDDEWTEYYDKEVGRFLPEH